MNLYSYHLQLFIGHSVFLCFYDEPERGKATSDLHTGLFNSQEVTATNTYNNVRRVQQHGMK